MLSQKFHTTTRTHRTLYLTTITIVGLLTPAWAAIQLWKYFCDDIVELFLPPGIYFLAAWLFLVGLVVAFCLVPIKYRHCPVIEDPECFEEEGKMRATKKNAANGEHGLELGGYSSAFEKK